MKKAPKKPLKLKRETLRKLTARDLEAVAGGKHTDFCHDPCGTVTYKTGQCAA